MKNVVFGPISCQFCNKVPITPIKVRSSYIYQSLIKPKESDTIVKSSFYGTEKSIVCNGTLYFVTGYSLNWNTAI